MATRASPTAFTIAALAAAAAVNVETVRYYQRRGLLRQPVRPQGGVRRYARTDIDQLRFIKRAQAMGFSLQEVKSLLELRTHEACRGTRALAATKLNLIDANIRELKRLRNELAELITACDANVDESHCPVMERLTH